MKKLMLSILFLFLFLNSKSQDTICTMVILDEVLIFNFYNSEIIDEYAESGDIVIEVGYREILCLHLYDQIDDSLQTTKKRKRKVTIFYPNGEQSVEKLESNDSVYYTSIGPLKVIVGKLKRRYL